MNKSLSYNSDLKTLIPFFAWLTFFIFGATVVGQIRFNMFPAYDDLILALIVPPVAGFTFLWLINQIYKIKINPEYIHGYTLSGWFKQVSWEDIESVYPKKMYGLNYLFVEIQDSSAILTIPTFLNDMDSFKSNVGIYGGTNNMLYKALQNET